jgi:hypothetical protein
MFGVVQIVMPLTWFAFGGGEPKDSGEQGVYISVGHTF